MALATNSTPGSIVLGGDLTGNANAPELRPTGVIPGSYTVADLVIDAKGRVVHAASSAIDGDITGTFGTTTNVYLVASGVAAGSYEYATIDVDSKGRLTLATNGVAPTLAGDVSGPMGATVLADTTVTPGAYTFTDITVDSKGRITAIASGTPSTTFFGDLTGSSTANVLADTSVVAGSYDVVGITVDSKGRLTAASATTFSGDLLGPPTANYLSDTGVVSGAKTLATFTVDSKGRLTVASSGSLTLAGDLTGPVGTNVLANTTVTPGSYTYSNFTVDSKGRLTAASSNPIYSDASYAAKGYTQVTAQGLSLSSGVLSGVVSSGSTVYGVVNSGDSSNIALSSGEVNVGTNIPKYDSVNVFSKSSFLSRQVVQPGDTTLTPDLAVYDVYDLTLTGVGVITINAPANVTDHQPFSFIPRRLIDGEIWTNRTGTPSGTCIATYPGGFIMGTSTGDWYVSTDAGATWSFLSSSSPLLPNEVIWDGSRYVATGEDYIGVSVTGASWSVVNVPTIAGRAWKGVAYNGSSVHCAIEGDAGSPFGGRSCISTNNGASWTNLTTMPSEVNWDTIVWDGSKFVAAGISSTAVGVTSCVATSTNGTAWTLADMGAGTGKSIYNLAWNGSVFVGAVSGTAVWYSNNGTSWTQISHGATVNPAIPSVVWNGRVFVMTDYTGSVLTSPNGITWTEYAAPSGTNSGGTGIGNKLAYNSAEETLCYVMSGAVNTSGNDSQFSAAASYKFSNAQPTAGGFTVDCLNVGGTSYCTYVY